MLVTVGAVLSSLIFAVKVASPSSSLSTQVRVVSNVSFTITAFTQLVGVVGVPAFTSQTRWTSDLNQPVHGDPLHVQITDG